MPDGTNTIDPPDDDQVRRLLSGEQQREPSRPESIWSPPGEGEHQMKGTYANVNPVEVGEAEAFLKREFDAARASRGLGAEPSLDPVDSRVLSGQNKYTDLALADDTRVAGGREVGQYAEAIGLTRAWDDEDRAGDQHDPTKVDPRTGVAYTNDEGGTVVLNPDGTVGMSLDPLGIHAVITADLNAKAADIDPTDLPDGVDAKDGADKIVVETTDIPLGGFDYPVQVDDGVPAVGEDGHAVLLDLDGDPAGSAADVDTQEALDSDREDSLGLTRAEISEKHDLRQDINAQANDQPADTADPVEAEVNPDQQIVNTDPQTVDPLALPGAPEPDPVPTTGAPIDPVEAEVISTDLGEKDASNQSGGTWSMANSKDELIAAAEAAGVDSSGTKEEILARLG